MRPIQSCHLFTPVRIPVPMLPTSSSSCQIENITLAGKLWNPSTTCTSTTIDSLSTAAPADLLSSSSAAASLSPVLLFVHQYAQMGGQGALMEGMAQQSLKYGFQALTFDLRGAGDSTGSCSYTNQPEVADVQAAIDFLIAETGRNIFLIGSSGGAPLAGAVLDYSPKVVGACLIGYVWGWWASWLFGWAYPALQQSPKPVLFVIGDRDEFTSMQTYTDKIAALTNPGNKQTQVIADKNHFEIEAPCYDKQVVTWITTFMKEQKLISLAAVEGEGGSK